MKFSSTHSLMALLVGISANSIAWAAPTPVESPAVTAKAATPSAPLNSPSLAKAQLQQIIRPVVNCTVNAGQVYSYDNGLEDSGRDVPVDLTYLKNRKEKTKNVLEAKHVENDVAIQIEVALDHPEIKNVLGKSVADQLTGIGNIVIKRRNPNTDKYEEKAKLSNRLSNEQLLHLDASVGPATDGEYRKATVSCFISPAPRTSTPPSEE